MQTISSLIKSNHGEVSDLFISTNVLKLASLHSLNVKSILMKPEEHVVYPHFLRSELESFVIEFLTKSHVKCDQHLLKPTYITTNLVLKIEELEQENRELSADAKRLRSDNKDLIREIKSLEAEIDRLELNGPR